MKKYLAILFAFIGIILTSCTKADYYKIADELNNEKYNYVTIEYNDKTDNVLCNYVKTVWDGKINQFDVHNTVLYYSYICDTNENYRITANIPTNKNLKITSVTEYYFHNFNYKNDEESRKIDYDIDDDKLSFDIDLKEINNNHIFQYYKINFKVDKTHYGYFYFSIRYGNELKSFKRTIPSLENIKSGDIDYVQITTNVSEDATTIDSGPLFDEVIPAIENIYLLKLENISYVVTYELVLLIQLKNSESVTIRINGDYICKYGDNYYSFLSTSDLLGSFIKSLVPKEKGNLN